MVDFAVENQTVVVIDGQGGRIGKLLIEGICAKLPTVRVLAVGTNSVATAAMMKAGAAAGATGENAVIVNARRADLIIGPLGIVIADSMMGEISPAMAVAIGQSGAKKLFIPINLCNHTVIGIADLGIKELVVQAINEVVRVLAASESV